MFLTNILLKRVKSKSIMVQMESVVSGHTFNLIRERLADKAEVIKFDPFILAVARSVNVHAHVINLIQVQKDSLYKEKKKIRSM